MKRIAIYSRKSKFTGKGDSIENQVEMCKEYINMHFSNPDQYEIYVYEDEGVSGKNLDRPQFKQFMKAQTVNPFDFLIVYRLDRVSRNVGDFSGLIEKLNSQGTSFISIKEQFDTSTPMGRAMMNIAAVFAQLERETIAERIKDNMYQLAKMGHWTGGTTPLGYKSVKHTYSNDIGKSKSYFTLEIDDAQIDIVKTIFEKYSELHSLNAIQNWLNENKIFTQNGKEWKCANIKRILESPIYCIADKDSLNYFNELGCNVCFDESDCDGVSGILPYNRHAGSNKQKSSPEKWLITVSTHKGLFNGKEWVRIQKLLNDNSKNRYGGISNTKQSFNKRSILSGVLRCGCCGDYMRPKIANDKMYYMCITKENTKRQKCSMPNVNGDELDRLVLDEIFSFDVNGSSVNQQLSDLRKRIDSVDEDISSQIKNLKTQKRANEKKIDNLVTAISNGASELTISAINTQISELTESNSAIDKQLLELDNKDIIQSQMQINLNSIESAIAFLKNNFDNMSIENRREFIKRIIEKVVWDGEKASVFCQGSTLLK